uniref:Aldehyde dehydrogenase family protein n=1 Tax=candidate division WOR-3 bacterium TaxID=2052148 RepID=A0A7C4CCB8_UNCW3
MEQPRLLIGGEWVETGRRLEVVNPYNESVIAEVPVAGETEVDAAIAAAEAGFAAMRTLPAHARASILNRCADLVDAHAAELASTIIAESGKPRRYAEAEVGRAVMTLRWAAGEAERIHGETVPMDSSPGSEHRRGFFIRVPLGVIAAITPFNFPLNLVVHKLAPAIAAGNSVVLKPASATPLTALKLGELLLEAGLPPAALNIVVGPGSAAGNALVRDARIRLVTFTGSAPVGETIRRESGLKRTTLELGSNSGAIVDETADIETAVSRCLLGAFAFSGQVCNHTQRLYLHRAIAADFSAQLIARARRLVCGNPASPETEVGPLISRAALSSVLGMIDEARAAGASIACGGMPAGTILPPTVLLDVTPEMKVVCEETFGPTCTIETFTEFDEAIGRFNEGSRMGVWDYGLAAGVFTRDVTRALRAAEELEVGSVYINDSATFRVDFQPYGGVKDSGTGREGPRFAIEEMTDIRMVSFHLDG